MINEQQLALEMTATVAIVDTRDSEILTTDQPEIDSSNLGRTRYTNIEGL